MVSVIIGVMLDTFVWFKTTFGHDPRQSSTGVLADSRFPDESKMGQSLTSERAV